MPNPLRLLPLVLSTGLLSPVIASNQNPIQVQEPNQAQTQVDSVILSASATSDDAFPSCAVNCSLLQQAQAKCVPPAAPENNDYETIASCFCESSLIDRLDRGSDDVCDDVCTASDRALLHAWYGRYCAGKNIKRETIPETSVEDDTEMAPAKKFSSSGTLKARGGGDWYIAHYVLR